ncbi:MAG: peptidoglycan-binding protein [Wenzhouxiangella sp.]|nr:MAG: peptidoglycan-binding protein [Wenzhouxiangella sp.]
MLLRLGSRGQPVVNLQNDLNRVMQSPYEMLQPDGHFGPKTEGLVREFQRKANITSDGIVGPKTRSVLNSRLMSSKAAARPASAPAAARPNRSPSDLTEAEVRQMVEDLVDNPDSFFRSISLSDVMFVVGRTRDLVGLALTLEFLKWGSAKATAGAAASTGAATAVGVVHMAGPVLFVVAAGFSWHKAVTTSSRTYGLRGSAYAYTSWVFGHARIDQSAEILRRIESFRDRDMEPYHRAWRAAADETRQKLQRADFGGTPPNVVKQTLRALYRDCPQNFCLDVLKTMAEQRDFFRRPLIPRSQQPVWVQEYAIRYPG